MPEWAVGKRKFRGQDILVFKSNRNRPLCTHHWLLHFAIEISTLRRICKYTMRQIKLKKAAEIGKADRAENLNKREGNHSFKYIIAWTIHSQFGKMFSASNTETLLEFKEYAITPWKEAKGHRASEGWWAKGRKHV